MPTTASPARAAKANGVFTCEFATSSRWPSPSDEPTNSPITAPITDLFPMAEPGIRRAAAASNEAATTFFFADHGLELYSNSILVREDFLAANGDMIRRFVEASQRGWQACFADPSAGADLFLRTNRGLDKPVVMARPTVSSPVRNSSLGANAR